MSAETVTIAQAAELTGISATALRRRVERGTLASVSRGGRRLILVAALRSAGLLDTDAEIPGAEPTPALTVDDVLDRLERQAEEIGQLRATVERLTEELEAERVLRQRAEAAIA